MMVTRIKLFIEYSSNYERAVLFGVNFISAQLIERLFTVIGQGNRLNGTVLSLICNDDEVEGVDLVREVRPFCSSAADRPAPSTSSWLSHVWKQNYVS